MIYFSNPQFLNSGSVQAQSQTMIQAIRRSILIILLAIVSLSCDKDEVPPTTHPDSAKYQRIVDKFMESGAVGVSITILSPKGIWHGEGGFSNKEKNERMSVKNTLRIGSFSKVFTAATILRLQEQGKLNVGDKISKYLPASITSRIANANEVTIEQCLNHTTGIREYMDESVQGGIFSGTIVKYSAIQNLALIYDKPADFTIGKVNYSNTNYLLLSEIIRIVTSKSAYQAVTELVISPMELPETFASTILPATLTQSYFESDAVMNNVTRLDNNAIGGEGVLDGGMIATSHDVALFLESLLKGKVISQSSLNKMQTFKDIDPNTLPEDLQYYKQYGLGLMKIETEHGTAIGHDGHVYGFVGKAFHLTEHNITIAMLLNSWSPKSVAVLNAKSTFNLLF